METITDPEISEWLKKALVEKFGSERILDYSLEEIAWALDQGGTYEHLISGKTYYTAEPIMSPDRTLYRSKQQALVTYIFLKLETVNKFVREDDDLLCTYHGLIKGKLEKWFG